MTILTKLLWIQDKEIDCAASTPRKTDHANHAAPLLTHMHCGTADLLQIRPVTQCICEPCYALVANVLAIDTVSIGAKTCDNTLACTESMLVGRVHCNRTFSHVLVADAGVLQFAVRC